MFSPADGHTLRWADLVDTPAVLLRRLRRRNGAGAAPSWQRWRRRRRWGGSEEGSDQEADLEAARPAGATGAAKRACRLRAKVFGGSNAGVVDRELRERRGLGCCSSRSDRRKQDADGPDEAGDPLSSPSPPPPLSGLAHPLLGRFAEPGVEAAFAVYKANTFASNRLTICLTLALLALSIASVAVHGIVPERRGGSGDRTKGHSTFSDISSFAVITAIYGVRVRQLLFPRPCLLQDVGFHGGGKDLSSRWRRWWRAFQTQHYMALLLLLPVLVEALLRQSLLMALNLASSCVFLLAASSLLLAHAVVYCALAWYAIDVGKSGIRLLDFATIHHPPLTNTIHPPH